jgi:molecular chaperone DnaK (HSP70)
MISEEQLGKQPLASTGSRLATSRTSPLTRRSITLDLSPAFTTGLQSGDISTVEVLGGSTRVPAVFKLVETVFGVTPSRTLNAKEVVSRGAALQCAMISPLIKVWAGVVDALFLHGGGDGRG